MPEWPGWVAGLFLAVFLTLPMAAVLWHAGGGSAPQPADWAALRFTVLQALISAGVSVALAIPVARALSRRQFRGRALLLGLMG
ncbi:MAG: thiamine/thiamine pyrophosphate ABC transporter permease ThiP, partial [Lutimaribacter sp.]